MFVVVLQHWNDEAEADVIGTFTWQIQAYRAAWKAEILLNLATVKVKNHPYIARYREIDNVTEFRAYQAKFVKDREDYLGGENSPGHRYEVVDVIEHNSMHGVFTSEFKEIEKNYSL